MKKLFVFVLVICMLFSLSILALAENQSYTVLKAPVPDSFSDRDRWDVIAQYKDSKEPITLSYYYDGYVFATVPAANKDREIEAFLPTEIAFADYNNDASGDFFPMRKLSETGVIKGNEKGEAKPYDNVTRAEAVAMVMRFMGLENMQWFDKSIHFSDVNKSDWFYDAVNGAYQCGIAMGDSESQFSPDRNVTREEIAVMTARALKYAALNCGPNTEGHTIYEDADTISDWAMDAYEFLDHHIPKNYADGEFDSVYSHAYLYPQRDAQRKDVAEVLYSLVRACQFYPSDLAAEYGFDKQMPVIDGSTSTYPFTQAVYSALFYNGTNHEMYPQKHSKSHASYERLINGEVDMLFASVYPASDILALAEEKGVELELIPIAYDAMIFFTNKDNPATSLTKEQISDIYVNNKYDSWSQLGGGDALLYPYCRNNDSGSHAQMEKHFLDGNEIHEKIRNETTSVTMSNVLTDVMAAKTDDPTGYALGYSIYYYYHNMFWFYPVEENLKLLAIDGVHPTDETIADGTYPLSNNTYVVLRKDTPPDAPARKMAEFMLTETGQSCVEAAGYGKLSK